MTLATSDLSQKEPLMDAARMEAFSDGVIAIIVTIMVLDLHPPVAATPTALLNLWPTFLAYVLSFTLVATYWVNHHHLLHAARAIGADVLWMNIHWLFWLSLMPFATAYLGATRGSPFATVVYSALSAIVAFSYLLLTRSLTRRNAHVPAVQALASKRQTKNILAMVAMLAAMPAAYVWQPLALMLLAAPAVAYFLPEGRAAGPTHSKPHGDAV